MTMAPIYSAAKAGVVQFARSIGPPLAERGIAVSALCPQPTETPMVHKWFTSGDPLPETGTATLTVEQVRWLHTGLCVFMQMY
jgi:NAD(P)-dependent dehydrogenase (short-subunit alcohol dehydrogenase family)